jgi:hypothetical protein
MAEVSDHGVGCHLLAVDVYTSNQYVKAMKHGDFFAKTGLPG